jgi:Na+-translocating ferredoxin:NAD+ oxidoreductase RnfD subunit
VDEPGERLYHRHQRRNFGSLTGLLALRVMQCDFDHVEVRAAIEGSTPLEPFKLWSFSILFPGGRDDGGFEYSMGKLLAPLLLIWILGSIIIWRAKRFHISATYVISFFVFAFLRSWITGDPWQSEIAPITGPMYQLFVFFMVTDPKTTVKPKWGQILVVFLVAFAEFIFRLMQVVYAPFYALFTVGPAANMIEIWWESRKQQATTVN